MTGARSLKIFLIFMGLAALVLFVAILPESKNSLAISLVVLLGAVCFCPVVLDLLGGRFDPFELIHIICLLCFLWFGAATLYMIYNPLIAWDFRVFSYINVSLVLCVAGVAFMVYGYILARRFRFRRNRGQMEVRGVLWVAGVFFVGILGEVANLLAERQQWDTRVSGLVSLFQQFEFLTYFPYFLLLCLWFAGRATFAQKALLACGIVPFELAFVYLRLGSKTFALTILGLPIVAATYSRRKLPSKTLLALLLFAVFVVFPVYGTFRQTRSSYSIKTRLSKTVDTLSGRSTESYTEQSLFIVAQRMALINSVAVVVAETGGSVDYQYGRTLGLIFVSMAIPRILWPDKPVIALGREFAREFHIVPRFNQETHVSPTPIGEFYWNFGVPGVLLGMFLMGVLLQLLSRFADVGAKDPVRLSIYGSLLPLILGFEANMAGWLVGISRALICYVFLTWILRSTGLLFPSHGTGKTDWTPPVPSAAPLQEGGLAAF